MNILRIVYDWPEPWYGLAPGPYYLSRAQGLLGYKVTVLTGGLNGSRLLRLRWKERPERNVTVYHLPRALSRHLGPFLTTSPIALLVYLWRRFILRKVDLVHGHGHTMLCFNLYKLFFKWVDRTPYVAHFHISSKERYNQAKARGEKLKFFHKYWEYPLHNLSDKLGVKVADAVIFPSKTTKEQFVKYYNLGASEKLFVVENGVPAHIFHPSGSKQLSFNKEILCVAVISPRKGINLLIEALKYLPTEYTLRCVGNVSDPSYKEELEGLARNLGVEHRMIFSDPVSNLDLAPYYRNATIFALPSQAEGLPKVVIESLACGTPVIASGFRSQVDLEGLNYFSSLTPRVVAKEIKKVVEENQKVDVDKVKKLFSWDAKAREIDKIYKRIILFSTTP